jgi:anaerobic C4-dicarboxylate transporter
MALVQRVNYSQAASIVTPNILMGTAIEYLGKASLIDLYAAAFLAAANDTIGLTYTQGGDSRVMVPAGSGINVNAAGPQIAFDALLSDYPVPQGAHLVLSVTSDATAGTHTGRFMIGLKP